MRQYYQGRYKVKNPEKYVGDANNVIYRSSYELKFMNFLDNHPNVKRWGSEELIIPYTWNGEAHRYFPDFVVEMVSKDGTLKKMLVEIKPWIQTQPPAPPKKKSQKALLNFENAIMTYTKNIAKWEHAKKFAERNNCQFVVLTEKELFKQKNG